MLHGNLIGRDESTFTFDNRAGSTIQSASPDGDSIVIPDAHLLFYGEFKRLGDDLKLVGEDGKSVLIKDYFKHEHLAKLLSPEGAGLTGDVVEALAGPAHPGQYAQAAPAPGAAEVIGRIAKVAGNATVLRNGVAITVNAGDAVLKGDILQTGGDGALGVTFNDGTAFSLTANARIVVSEYIYEAGGSHNAALFNVVRGTVSFVASQVAKTGDMKIATPTATMGIRGTTGVIEAAFVINDPANPAGQIELKIKLYPDSDGHLGRIEVFAPNGTLLGTITQQGVVMVVTPGGQGQALAQFANMTQDEINRDLGFVRDVFESRDLGQQFIDHPNQNTNPDTKGTNGQGTQFIPSDQSKLVITYDASTNKYEVSSDNGQGGNNHNDQTDSGKKTGDDTTGDTTQGSTNSSPQFRDGPVNTSLHVVDKAFNFDVHMSADGNVVVFTADNDMPAQGDDTQNHLDRDVYLYSREHGGDAIQLSTFIKDGPAFENTGYWFQNVKISADGKVAVFQADILSAPSAAGYGEFAGVAIESSFIYVHKVGSDEAFVLRDENGFVIQGGNPDINGDGSKIVLEDGGHGILYVDRDMQTGETARTVMIADEHAVWNPGISADGKVVTFWSDDALTENDTDSLADLYAFNVDTQTYALISHSIAGHDSDNTASAVDQWRGSLSIDGQMIAFQSDDSSLVAGDTDNQSDIFVYDQLTHDIVFSTVPYGGVGESYRPQISLDGKFVIFVSQAQLTSDDTNTHSDVYIADLDNLDSHGLPILHLVAGNIGEGSFTASIGGAGLAGGGLPFYAVDELFGGSGPNPVADIELGDPSGGTVGVIIDDPNAPQLTAKGMLYFVDEDDNQFTIEFAFDPAHSVNAGETPLGSIAPLSIDDSFTLHQAQWTYQVDESALRHLANGEKIEEHFTATLTDGHGNVADNGTKDVVVVLVGLNDAPAIEGDQSETHTFSIPAGDGEHNFGASDNLVFTDPDDSDHHHIQVFFDAGASSENLPEDFVPVYNDDLTSISTPYGTFMIPVGDFVDAADGNQGIIHWEFVVTPGQTDAFNALAEGTTIAYDIHVTDDFGAEAVHQVAIEVESEAPTAGGQVVVFDNGSFVDTSGGYGAESDNVQASLASLGYDVSTFTDYSAEGFTAALAGKHALVFPENENSFLSENFLSSVLSTEAKDVIQAFVSDGGNLIVHGYTSDDAALINTIFGTNVWSVVASSSDKTAAAIDAFVDDPSSLPWNDGVSGWSTSSLPDDAFSIYANENASTVAAIPYGQGNIVFLGWDWYDAQPVGSQNGGWLQVLDSAINFDPSVTVQFDQPYDLTSLYSDIAGSQVVGSNVDQIGDYSAFVSANIEQGIAFKVYGTGFSYGFGEHGLDVFYGTIDHIEIWHSTYTGQSDFALSDLTDLVGTADGYGFTADQWSSARNLYLDNEGDESGFSALFSTVHYDMTGSTGAEDLWGGRLSDHINSGGGGGVIEGKHGNDQLEGGTGPDTFLFRPGDGNDIIVNFSLAADKIDLTDFSYSEFSDIDQDIAYQSGNAVINLGNGQTITVEGLTGAPAVQLTDAHFLFHPATLVS